MVEVRPRIQSHIAWLEQELNDLDAELAKRYAGVRCGASRTTCCAAMPAWENQYP